MSESPFPNLEQLPPVVLRGGGDPVAAMRSHHNEQRRAGGYEVGYEEGFDAGLSAADARTTGAASALAAAVDDLRTRETTAVETLAAEAVELALVLAEAIVGREVAASAAPGRDGLVRALALAPETGPVEARLNPTDVAGLGDVSELLPGREIVVVPDPRVESGGCLLQVGATRIDAQIGSALERVRAELLSEELLHVEEPPTSNLDRGEI